MNVGENYIVEKKLITPRLADGSGGDHPEWWYLSGYQ